MNLEQTIALLQWLSCISEHQKVQVEYEDDSLTVICTDHLKANEVWRMHTLVPEFIKTFKVRIKQRMYAAFDEKSRKDWSKTRSLKQQLRYLFFSELDHSIREALKVCCTSICYTSREEYLEFHCRNKGFTEVLWALRYPLSKCACKLGIKKLRFWAEGIVYLQTVPELSLRLQGRTIVSKDRQNWLREPEIEIFDD